MANELTFYTNPMSRGRIVRWMLEEASVEYETSVIEYGPAMKGPEYLAVNPMGKVPAISHNGEVVTETAAICTYLADVFPDAGLAPPVSERASYYRWLFYFAGPVEAAVMNRHLELEVPEDKQGMVGYGNYGNVMDVLDNHLANNEFMAGGSFTTADVYCGSQVGWGLEFGTFEKRPAFEAYWERLSSRPAKLRADELDNALMPEQSN